MWSGMWQIKKRSPSSFWNIKSINMAVANLDWEMKGRSVSVALVTNHSYSEIAIFLEVTTSFVFKVMNKVETFGGDLSAVAKTKKNVKQSDVSKTTEFFQKVWEKSMRTQ